MDEDDELSWHERVAAARDAGIILRHTTCPRCGDPHAEEHLLPDGDAVRCGACGYQDAPY